VQRPAPRLPGQPHELAPVPATFPTYTYTSFQRARPTRASLRQPPPGMIPAIVRKVQCLARLRGAIAALRRVCGEAGLQQEESMRRDGRLQRAKQWWDPHDIFHHGRPIALP
jgi:hypothetical protein